MLSVIIITKNEAQHIRDCLDSVSWADEIVVVDSGSEDSTVEICKEFPNCKITQTDWPGFGPQKNRALELATHEWVLSIDADERVTEQLKIEILEATKSNQYSGFNIPRSSQYCGKFIKHAGWYPDYVLRLFKREQAHFSTDKVHEKVVFQGSTQNLSTPLIHYSFQNLDQVIAKMNQYSTLGAEQLYARGKKASLATAVGKGIWSFIRTYFLRAGFMEGKHGLMLAISNAEGTYYKYSKLALLCEKDRTSA